MTEKTYLLSEFSVQEIQLELIRRTEFNHFRGERVATDLMIHKELWEAVLIDREYRHLVKIRDLKSDTWNVDTLYILAPHEESVIKLLELSQWWSPDEIKVLTEKETGKALGSTSIGQKRLVCMYWD